MMILGNIFTKKCNFLLLRINCIKKEKVTFIPSKEKFLIVYEKLDLSTDLQLNTTSLDFI